MDIRKLTPGHFQVTQKTFFDGPDDRSDRDQSQITSVSFFTRCSLWGKTVDVVFRTADHASAKPPLAPERFAGALNQIKANLVWVEAHREPIVSAMVEERSQPSSLFDGPETEGLSPAKFRSYVVLQAVVLGRSGGFELFFNPWEPGSHLHLCVSVDETRTRLEASSNHYERPQ